MPTRTQAADADRQQEEAEEADAPTEAEVLRFFDLFLAHGRGLSASQAAASDAASDGGGWERVLGQEGNDADDDKESEGTVGSGSETSRSSSSAATSQSASTGGGGHGAASAAAGAPVGGVMRDFHGFEIKARPDPMASGSDQLRLEWVNARRLPFRFSAVAREIWRFLSDPSILEQSMPGMTRTVQQWENELLATTDLVFPVSDHSVLLHAAAAFRLTLSSEFAHINWISHGDCRAKKGAKDAFQIIEKGWTRIEPLPESEDACIVRTVSYHMPSVVSSAARADDADDKGSGDDSSESAEIGILTELVCGAYDKSLGHLYAVIQNALMEQELCKQRAAE